MRRFDLLHQFSAGCHQLEMGCVDHFIDDSHKALSSCNQLLQEPGCKSCVTLTLGKALNFSLFKHRVAQLQACNLTAQNLAGKKYSCCKAETFGLKFLVAEAELTFNMMPRADSAGWP